MCFAVDRGTARSAGAAGAIAVHVERHGPGGGAAAGIAAGATRLVAACP